MARSNLRDQPKGMTKIHRRLALVISNLGFHVENEYPFPPYQVDILLPDEWVAFEADGRGHLKERDSRRDAELDEVYGLKVRRFDTNEITGDLVALEEAIIEFIEEYAESAQTRKKV